MNVCTLKLINGEEILGDVSHIGSANSIGGASEVLAVHINTPVVFQMVQNPETGQPMRAFADWPAMAAPDQTVVIPVSSIASLPIKAHEELERQYVANVTGLELPPATPKILLG